MNSNPFSSGDKVKIDGDNKIYTVYAVYSDTEVSLGLYDYPDVEQDYLTSIDMLTGGKAMNQLVVNGWNVYESSRWPELYLDYVNNFLTVERFAEYYGMTQEHAEEIIFTGRKTDNFTKNWSK